jgi:hypothetical protein
MSADPKNRRVRFRAGSKVSQKAFNVHLMATILANTAKFN